MPVRKHPAGGGGSRRSSMDPSDEGRSTVDYSSVTALLIYIKASKFVLMLQPAGGPVSRTKKKVLGGARRTACFTASLPSLTRRPLCLLPQRRATGDVRDSGLWIE